MLSMVINAGQCKPFVSDRAAETIAAMFKARRRKPMPSRESERFAASRGTAAMLLAGMLVLGFGLPAAAQSVDDGSQNGLEGTWRAQLTIIDCQPPHAVLRTFKARFSFAEGGTLTVTTAGQPPSQNTPGLGVWNYMYGRTYSAVSEAFVFSPAGVWTSTQRLTRVITVSRDGKRYTDSVALEILDINDNVIVTGCGTSVATRLE
jgi:hypothetical protein